MSGKAGIILKKVQGSLKLLKTPSNMGNKRGKNYIKNLFFYINYLFHLNVFLTSVVVVSMSLSTNLAV